MSKVFKHVSTHDFYPVFNALVESINNGNQMVPTLVFSDGTTLINPSAMQVKEKLSAR